MAIKMHHHFFVVAMYSFRGEGGGLKRKYSLYSCDNDENDGWPLSIACDINIRGFRDEDLRIHFKKEHVENESASCQGLTTDVNVMNLVAMETNILKIM